MSGVQLEAPGHAAGHGKHYQSAAFEQKPTVVTGLGQVSWIEITNKNAGTMFVYVFDNTTDAGTALVCPPIPVATNSRVQWDCRYGVPFTTGLTLAISSTLATYTAQASNDAMYHVIFTQRAKSP